MHIDEPVRGRHRATDVATSPVAPKISGWLVPALWGGRVLVLTTAAVVLVSRATREWWMSQGLDAGGYPRSWLPNLTLILTLVVGLFGQWLCGLAVSPEVAWREGDEVVAHSVVGRRRVTVAGALIVQFRILSRQGTGYGALLIDRRVRALVLLDPFATGDARVGRLLGSAARGGFARACVEYLVGLVWLAVVIASVFALLGLVLWVIGYPG